MRRNRDQAIDDRSAPIPFFATLDETTRELIGSSFKMIPLLAEATVMLMSPYGVYAAVMMQGVTGCQRSRQNQEKCRILPACGSQTKHAPWFGEPKRNHRAGADSSQQVRGFAILFTPGISHAKRKG